MSTKKLPIQRWVFVPFDAVCCFASLAPNHHTFRDRGGGGAPSRTYWDGMRSWRNAPHQALGTPVERSIGYHI